MAGTITKKLRLHNAEQFFESFNEAAETNMYIFIGRSNEWPDDSTPPTPLDTVEQVEYDPWKTMLSMKRITPSDVSFAIPRVDWTSGTVYVPYSSDSVFNTSDFYVMTDDYNIYKCMDNNGGVASTSKPIGTSENFLTTADGYTWKYMYSISGGDALKFVSSAYIPVKYLTANNGTAQWTVQQAATNGSIETLQVTTGGSAYQYYTSTLVTANSSSATLQSAANSTSGSLVGSTIYISSGTGAGQIRDISSYVGASRIAYVSQDWSITPDTSSIYIVGPKITIAGDATSNATAYAIANAGIITKATVISAGANYSYANTTVTANSGSGATIHAEIGPRGGHGANAVSELYGHNVMMNVKTLGTESNTYMIGNDFRVFGVIADPLLANSSSANASSYLVAPRLALVGASGTFSVDEMISGGTSNASAKVIEYWNGNTIMISDVTGTFSNGEIITGNTSAETATINGILETTLQPYTGEILYIENRSPVSRAEDQQEDVKITVRF